MITFNKNNESNYRRMQATIIEYQGQRQLISPAAEVTFSYNPANGQELWRVRHPGWGRNSALWQYWFTLTAHVRSSYHVGTGTEEPAPTV